MLAEGLWRPEGVYLNTASYGLPPDPTWDAMQAVMGDWRAGRTSWEVWGESTERARGAFGRLLGVPPERVATGSSVAGFMALVAGALGPRTRVVVPEQEFTSATWPLVARGLDVREVPLADLADAAEGADVLVFSAVQSATGERADLATIAEAARAAGTATIVDATQALGWVPMAPTPFDVVLAATYKWLMSPRGCALMALSDEWLERVPPLAANWWASDPPDAYYGLPVRLPGTARRLDTSPAWFSWVGCAESLELVERLDPRAIERHDVDLANALRAGLGLEPTSSAIVIVDAGEAAETLEARGILAAVRAGRLRTSWHVYNSRRDVEATLEALGAG